MPHLKITDATTGATLERFLSPDDMRKCFSRAERAELELTGRVRQKVRGGTGSELIELLGPRVPAAGNTASRVGGLYYLLVNELRGAEYVVRYTEAEMAEIFREEDRHDLAKGGTLITDDCRYVDMVAAARAVRD